MNERIKELAEQCGFKSNPDIYDRNQSFDILKFAQLIVQECANIDSRRANWRGRHDRIRRGRQSYKRTFWS